MGSASTFDIVTITKDSYAVNQHQSHDALRNSTPHHYK